MPLEDIAPDVLNFVDSYIDHFTAWDVLSYFHHNPDASSDVRSIAADVGRTPAAVQPVVDSLMRKGILASADEPQGVARYRYTANTDFRMRMSRFMDATRERPTRLAIVSHVLRKEVINGDSPHS